MEPLHNTIDIAKHINEELYLQTQQLETSHKQIKELEKDNLEAKRKINAMNSYFYSLYYWMTSFFDYNNAVTEIDVKHHTIHQSNIQVPKNTDTYLSQLEELENMSHIMGTELDIHNNLIDKIQNKSIKNIDLFKKNYIKMEKI